jgi:hypothetical protein
MGRRTILLLAAVATMVVLGSGVALAQVIVGTANSDTPLNGTNNPDLIKALGGNDTVNAKGAADDLMSGGAANDGINAANQETVGTPDTVNCGSGIDVVRANNNDTVADNCEDVTRVANPR